MNTRNSKWLLAILLAAGLPGKVRAQDYYSPMANFHFPVGVGISSGHFEVFDEIKNLYRNAGFQVHDDLLVPVGLSFSPYYEFPCGFGLGLSLGPTAFFEVHEETFVGGPGRPGPQPHEDRFSYIVPVGADVRYTFLRQCNVSPYIRAGVRFPIAGGDNLGDGQVGPYVGAGVELFRTTRIAGGIEFGYDASRVRVNGPNNFGGTSKVTYSGFTGSLFVVF
jgi:hypothetical protein